MIANSARSLPDARRSVSRIILRRHEGKLRHAQRVLEQDRGSKGIDVGLSSARAPIHLANGAQRNGGGEPLVQQRDRQSRPPRDLGGYLPAFERARRVVAISVQRQGPHHTGGLHRLSAPKKPPGRPTPSPPAAVRSSP